MSEKIQKLSPVGRLIQGDAFSPSTTDAEGNPLVIKNGPNAGQPRVEYFMALAIPKTDPAVNAFIAEIQGVARTAFPTLHDPSGACIQPSFAFKMIDGDSMVPNKAGKIPAQREGFPGNWIFNFSGGYAPKVYTAGGASIIVNPEELKRGYFVRIYASINGNGSMQQPGIYLNPSMVELIAYGEEIVSGPDGQAVFGGAPAPAQLPMGASATPMAPVGAPIAQPAPAMAPAMAQPAPAMAQPAPAMAQPAMAQPAMAQPAPAHDFVAGAPAQPAPAERMYTVQGVQYAESALRAQGWTDAQLATLG